MRGETLETQQKLSIYSKIVYVFFFSRNRDTKWVDPCAYNTRRAAADDVHAVRTPVRVRDIRVDGHGHALAVDRKGISGVFEFHLALPVHGFWDGPRMKGAGRIISTSGNSVGAHY